MPLAQEVCGMRRLLLAVKLGFSPVLRAGTGLKRSSGP